MKTKASKQIFAALLAMAMLLSSVIAFPQTIYATGQSPGIRWLDATAANALVENAKQEGLSYVRIGSGQYDGIRADAAEVLSGFALQYDTCEESAVLSRLYIDHPEQLQADTVLASEDATKIQAKFERFFSNKLRVLNLSWQGGWGQTVRVALRADLAGVSADNLCAYTYNSAENTYQKLTQADFEVDETGSYIYFNTSQGGAIVISAGTLDKRPVPLAATVSSTSRSDRDDSRGSSSSSGSGGGGNATPTTVPVTSVAVSPGALSLSLGASGQLTAAIMPANATNQSVTWSSSDAAIAAVDGNGLVTANGTGNATVTATTADGGYTAACIVSVNTLPPATTPVTGVTVSPGSATITVGGTQQLTANIAPANATNQGVTWSSSNTAVATVDANGLVTAVSSGNTTITVTTDDGGYSAGCAVTVSAAVVPVTGVTVSPGSAAVTEGGTQQLTANIAPASATNQGVTWSSSNTAVATVDGNGLVTTVIPGTATITVTTADGGFTDSCSITVNALVNAVVPTITTQPQTGSVLINDIASLSVAANVTDGGTLSYQWYSNTVNSNSGGTAISGETGSSFAIPTSATGYFYYYCEVTNTNTSATGVPTAAITSNAAEVYVKSPYVTSVAGASGMIWYGDGYSAAAPLVAYVPSVSGPLTINSTSVVLEDAFATTAYYGTDDTYTGISAGTSYAGSITDINFTVTTNDGDTTYYRIYLAQYIPFISFDGPDAGKIQQIGQDMQYSLDGGTTWHNAAPDGASKHQLTVDEVDSISGTSWVPGARTIHVKLKLDMVGTGRIALVLNQPSGIAGLCTTGQPVSIVYFQPPGGITLGDLEFRVKTGGSYGPWTTIIPATHIYNVDELKPMYWSGGQIIQARVKGHGNTLPGRIDYLPLK